jgi:hypothetical protein
MIVVECKNGRLMFGMCENVKFSVYRVPLADFGKKNY